MSAENRNALRGKIEKLIPLINEKDKDWVCDWDNDKQEKFYVVLHHGANVCFLTADRTSQRIGAIYMSEETGNFIKDTINAGLTKKIKGL